MANELNIDDESLIEINKLMFIGGERRQYDNEGQILLSGTEKEVESLTDIVKTYDFTAVDIDIDENNIEHHHFLTSGEQSLTVKISLNELNYEIKNSDELEERYNNQEFPNPF
ncbi:Uncharacterised protein [Legionella busanensis]|uniref:Uncharacterized protein n=1 Tax=Legionella busanensis TaxID=190655 RepID=A0A378JJG9_9GAMM|nr:hypothetical protein [Legionella busanensis]STX51456.1 Uncharacterised protein [Legionella busanensis]